MKFNAQQVQQLMVVLRNTAEVDPTDEIANAASQIAYELETVKLPFDFNDLNEKRQKVVRYAYSKRSQYIRVPGDRHATDLMRVEKPRRVLKKRLTAH